MDKNKFLETIQNCEQDTDLRNYLSKLYIKNLNCLGKDNLDLENIDYISHILRKYAKKTSADKAFVCGVYSERFNNLKEEALSIQRENKILTVLSDMENRKLFTFLFNNGCCQYEKIAAAFPVENLADILEKFLEAELVWETQLTTDTYYELTAMGYVYYNKTIGRWGVPNN